VVAYGEKIEELLRQYDNGLRAFFLTLTVKNGCELPVVYDHFSRSVSRLTSRYQASKKAIAGSVKHRYALSSVMAPVVAGVLSIEIKKGANSGLWHPHTHGLLLSTERIDKRHLSGEWESITGDSRIVDCREVDPTDTKTLCEVLKYSLKFSEMSLEDNFEAAMELAGRRFLRSFGGFYDMKPPDPSMDIDDTTVLHSPYVELLYEYRKGSYTRVPSDGAIHSAPMPYKRGN
jgi:hypothetical protein